MIPADLTRDELLLAWKRCPWFRRHGIGFAAALADPLMALALRANATHHRRKQQRAAEQRAGQRLTPIHFSLEPT